MAAIAAVLVVAVATTAYATGVVTQHIKANISPSKAGTATKPKPVKLNLHLFVTTSDNSVPPPANHDIVFLPRGLVFQGSHFKSCTAATLNDPNQGPSKCPSGSKVGGGTATAHIGGDPNGPNESLVVTVFNGPKGKSVLLHIHGTSPATIDGAFEGKLIPIKGSGPYGLKLDVKIPQNLYEPAPGVFTPLTDFNTNITGTTRVKGKQYGITATTACPRGHKWQFKAIFNYANSAPQDNANTQVKCSS
ncbi:MAG: hypothetical protein ACJ76Z_01620 [Thermoleophilaceae bacterium]